MNSTIIVGDRHVKLTVERKLITNKMYGWSKYGGVNLGLVQENLTPEWSCQACGGVQTDDLPPYMFEFLPREFIRICSPCQYIRQKDQINTFDGLLGAVRRSHDLIS